MRLLGLGLTFLLSSQVYAAPIGVRLKNHVQANAISVSTHLGRIASNTRMKLAIAVPPTDPVALDDLVKRLYDPKDPQYHQFLSTQQFNDRFSPSAQTIADLTNYLASQGLTVTQVHGNRMLIDVEAAVGDIENAFQLQLHQYRTPDGRTVHAATSDPMLPPAVARNVAGIVGLDGFGQRRPHVRGAQPAGQFLSPLVGQGTGPGGTIAPADIIKAYNLSAVTANGAGQTLGLLECDGYTASDISAYTTHFGLPAATLQNVLIDGFSGTPNPGPSGTPGNGQIEVTLDIQMMTAVAPGASRILVYESPCTTDLQWLDMFNRAASDNLARQISLSWGQTETSTSAAAFAGENTALQQMAAQGQSFFVAAGDSGAYDNGTSLSVDDPCVQSYATCVGGTKLSLNANQTYNSETPWGSSPLPTPHGGGGGISTRVSIPSWQSGLATAANQGSNTMRMVPDIALNSDPASGYGIYVGGGWYQVGGTSAAAPLWAAFTALVNQQRVSASLQTLGFMNTTLYQIGKSSISSSVFNDIATGNNLFYNGVSGYDLATGWGTFNGQPLFNALASAIFPPLAPTGVTAKVVP